jgi:hypothetical protein
MFNVSSYEWFKQVFSGSAKTISRIAGFAFLASLVFLPPGSGLLSFLQTVARWYWLWIFYPGILIAALASVLQRCSLPQVASRVWLLFQQV